jgi:SGNH domain (fused to AT3 domains)
MQSGAHWYANRKARALRIVRAVALGMACALWFAFPQPSVADEPAAPGSRNARKTGARFVLIGDSIAHSLGDALRSEADRHGIRLEVLTRIGCGLTPGIPTLTMNPEGASACLEDLDRYMTEVEQRASRSQAVIWFSSWEINDPLVGGEVLRYRSDAWDAWFVDQLEQARVRFTTDGGALVLVTIPPNEEPDSENARRAAALTEIFRDFAAAHRSDVGVADFSRILCPRTQCIETIADGMVRPDNWHFSGHGGAWAAPRLLASVRKAVARTRAR